MPIFAAPLVAALMQGLRWFFLAKLAAIVTRMMVTLGLALATNEYVIQPFLDAAVSKWNALPEDVAVWISFFGIGQVVSIMLTAYSIAGVKQVFLTKR